MKSNAKHRLEEDVLLGMVQNYRKQMPRIGGAKLHYLINQSGYRIGRKTLYDLLYWLVNVENIPLLQTQDTGCVNGQT